MTTARQETGSWVRILNKYHVRIHGIQIDAVHPVLPHRVDVYRQDGTATRHTVTGLIYSGIDPVVSVERHPQGKVPDVPTPEKPDLMWKHSRRHSKLVSKQDYNAVVHRIRRNSQTLWTFRIDRHEDEITIASMAVATATRRQAVDECETTIRILRKQHQTPCP